jgi:hypothetical protein
MSSHDTVSGPWSGLLCPLLATDVASWLLHLGQQRFELGPHGCHDRPEHPTVADRRNPRPGADARSSGQDLNVNRRMCTFSTRPDAAKAVEGRRAAVGHERQRNAGDRHDPERHADVLEDVEHEHQRTPTQISVPTSKVRASCAVRQIRHTSPPSKQASRADPMKPSSSPGTVKMKSVCCSGTEPPLV